MKRLSAASVESRSNHAHGAPSRKKHYINELDFNKEAQNLLRVRAGLCKQFPEVQTSAVSQFAKGPVRETLCTSLQQRCAFQSQCWNSADLRSL